MITSIIIVFIIGLIFYHMTKKPRGFPPGPFRAPIVGYATSIHPTKSHITFNALQKKYGDVSGVFMGTDPFVIVSGWEAVVEALNNNDLNNRPEVPLFITNVDNPFDMKGVMFTSGDTWKVQRRFSLHHFRNLGFGKRSHEDHILQEIPQIITALTKEKGPVDVQPILAVANINILWAILTGIHYSYDNESLQHLVKGICEGFRAGTQSGGGLLFAFPFLRHIMPDLIGYTLLENCGKNVKNVIEKTIDDHKKTFDPEVTRDFIDIYLKELQNENKEESFSETQLKVICNDLLIAGSETGSSLVGYCILYLCLYPDWQKTVYEELAEVLGKNGTRLPTIDDKQSLPKTEAFLNEIMRYRCPAPTTVPHHAGRDTTLRGFRIPKDTSLIINLRSVMMDEKYWDNPEEFRPERFLNEEGKFRNYDRMIPFGKGRRACMGEPLARMTSFLVFASLAYRLKFKLPPGKPVPDTEGVTGFTLGPPFFEVLIEERN